MNILFHDIFLEHDTGIHPENYKRIASFSEYHNSEIGDGDAYLELVHTSDYIKTVKGACKIGARLDADTIVSNLSFESAIKAVGATMLASEKGDLALVRPPGHHAYSDHASGFCLFNNIAIASTRLSREGKRILIFDFDGHLGDGTSDFFYGSRDVLFWSIHQYPAFPGKGLAHELGERNGAGFTMNMAMPPGSGDDLFWEGYEKFLPYAKAFSPDIVAVSAGFDGHLHDPLLDLNYSLQTFYEIGRSLSKNFKKIFAVLEGGYNLEVLPKAIYNFLAGINQEEMPYFEEQTFSQPRVRKLFEKQKGSLEMALEPYWGSLL